MLRHATFFAVSIMAYSGGSFWALLSGIAALGLLAITGDSVMARVLASADDDVTRQSLRLIASNALCTAGVAYTLGRAAAHVYG